MYIAVCDDDKDELLRISSILNTYRQERKAPIIYKTFENTTDLLAVAEQENFSLYLLDVMMPGIDGMAAAREIRHFDTETKLVFLTSSPEFAFQSYSVKAHDYLIKPAHEDKLFPILDALLAERQNPKECISLKSKIGLTRILYSNLAYVEVINKCVSFHLADGAVREITASLSEFEPMLLSRSEFIRVHRSYIVNLWQMSDLSRTGFWTLAGDTVPVSRLLYSKVKAAYVEQLFSKEVD